MLCLAAAGCATAPTGPDAKPVMNNLMTDDLQGAKGREVVVSRVTIPPHTTLPKHWHPGEEFAYVLEGSVTLWQEGKPDAHYRKGDVAKVPLKQVHTGITTGDGVELLVFRVHEKGQPQRVLVD